MTFTEEEIDYMIENYKIMADADQNRGVSAWAKFAVQVGTGGAKVSILLF